MFHEPPEIAYDCSYAPRRIAEGDLLLSFRDGEVMLSGEELPIASGLLPLENEPRFLFSVAGKGVYLAGRALPESEALHYAPLRRLRSVPDPVHAFAGITGWHLHRWYAGNRYCGACGAVLGQKPDERALVCPRCGRILYPVISPAVIAGVIWGEKLLLTRAAGSPSRGEALVSGYVEAGESLEAALRREVREETGLSVTGIRYFASQPWGFSGSLLAGFFARLDGDPEVLPGDGELAEARWVERSAIPAPGSLLSLTASMIEAFRSGAVR